MNKLSIKYQLKSFGWAINGLSIFFRHEVKAIIHSLASVIAVTLGFFLKLEPPEWIGVTIAISLVFISEIINTAIERIADSLPDRHDEQRGHIKDIAAGAVFIASITALIIGCIIFIPKILELWLR